MVRLKRYIRTKIDRKLAISLQRGPFDPKVQVEVVVPNQPIILLFRKLNDLWHGIKIVTVFCHNTRTGQTDGQTEFSSINRVYIPCSVVKNTKNVQQVEFCLTPYINSSIYI